MLPREKSVGFSSDSDSNSDTDNPFNEILQPNK